MLRKTQLNIPILTYHRVLPHTSDTSPFTLSEKQFEQQMVFLAENGYHTLTLLELLERMNSSNDQNGEAHPKEVVLTFDDGYRDNFETAFPILNALGLSATFFVITSRIESPEFMSWQQLAEMQQQNMHIESHAHTHTPLELLSELEIVREVTHSKTMLEQKLNKPVRFMSFPHGSYNKTALDAARDANYLACGTSNFGVVHEFSDTFELPRILIRKKHTIMKFESFCRGRGLELFKEQMLNRTKNSVKHLIGLNRYQNLHNLRYRIKRQSVYNQDESV